MNGNLTRLKTEVKRIMPIEYPVVNLISLFSELRFLALKMIDKFGLVDLYNFAKSEIDCPCSFLERTCYDCKYNIINNSSYTALSSCVEAIKYHTFSRITDCESVKTIKQILLKEINLKQKTEANRI